MQTRKLVLLAAIGGSVVLSLAVIFVLNSSSSASVTLAGHSGPTSSIAFSPSGALLASGTQTDGDIAIWSWPARELQRTLKGDSQGTVHLAFSPDGTLLAACTLGWTIDVWRIADGTRLAAFHCKPSHPQMAEFTKDPDQLIGLDEQTKGMSSTVAVRRWSIASGTSQVVLEHSGRGGARQFVSSIDQSRLYLATSSGAELWDIENRDAPLAFQSSPRAISHMALSNDQTLVATSAGIPASVLSVWDPATRTSRDLVQLADEEYFGNLAFLPADNKLLAVVKYRVGNFPSDIILFDAKGGQEIGRIAPAGPNVLTVAFSPDGRWLAAGGDGPIKLWDLQSVLKNR